MKKFLLQTWILQMIFAAWPRKIWLGIRIKLRKPARKRVVTLRLICQNFVNSCFYLCTGRKVRKPELKMVVTLRLI